VKTLILKIVAGVVAAVLILVVGVVVLLWRGDISYATLEQRYAEPASRYVDLPGGLHVHYEDQGLPGGPTVLLLHGFAMDLHTWAPWTRLLGRSYRIVALDLPGFGLTRSPKGQAYDAARDPEVVEAFAKALHLDRFVIGGSSMGGDVAWRYALAHPARVKGLILVDASGWPSPEPVFDRGSLFGGLLANPLTSGILLHLDNSGTLNPGFRAAFADPAKATPAFLKRYDDLVRAPARRPQWRDLLFGWDRMPVATPAKLAAIKAPTLILWGEKDQIVPLDSGRRFVAAIPGAHLIVYPNTGHLPEEEAAEASAADVGAFLHSLEAPKKATAAAAAPTEPAKKPEKNLLVFY
jgi:pimeloyl-ACP methyl ester carboxylesterase